jgi:hypothetical protein
MYLSSDRQLLEGFILTLFDWSRAWGFTTSTSITEFISSLSLLSHDVNFLLASVLTLCTLRFFSSIKFRPLPIKKKTHKVCVTYYLPIMIK